MTTFKTARHVVVGERVQSKTNSWHKVTEIDKTGGRFIRFILEDGLFFSCSPEMILCVEVAP